MRTRTVMIALVVVALVATLGLAQANRNKADAGSTTQTFIDLENKWNDALVKKDTDALAAILADGYVSTDERGKVRDKASIFARLKSGERNFQSMKLSDVHVYLHGDAAVVTGVNATTGTSDGKAMPPKMAFTDTFVRQNGVWRAIATHSSEVR